MEGQARRLGDRRCLRAHRAGHEDHNLLSWERATGAPTLREEAIARLGLNRAAVEHALDHLRRPLNEALRDAGYNLRSAQDLGYVADGDPPRT